MLMFHPWRKLCSSAEWADGFKYLLKLRNWTYVPVYTAEISAKIKRILYSSTLQRKKKCQCSTGMSCPSWQLEIVLNGIELDTVGGQFKPYL